MNETKDITIPATAMDWLRLISAKRVGMEEYHDPRRHNRSDFRRDYDRMIFSSPFRRLQNKTQVFPLPGSIFVHNRLTHSLEVSSVGRSIATDVADELCQRYPSEEYKEAFRHLPDIVATGCLAHDLGNPPFGHSGEKAIGTFFSEGAGRAFEPLLTADQWSDITRFEGNANSLRLLTHQFAGRRAGGFAMTYSAVASIVKYPYASRHAGKKGKFGFFTSETDTFRRVAEELSIPHLDSERLRFARHPLVYLVEAADDICYQIMDIEDAHKLRILDHDETFALLLTFFPDGRRESVEATMATLDDPNEKVSYLRSGVIGTLVDQCSRAFLNHEQEILRGTLKGSLIDNMPDTNIREAYSGCSRTAFDKIYVAPDVVDIELAGHTIMTYLLERLLHAVQHPTDYDSQLLLQRIPRQYETSAPDIFTRVQSALDHISGMTDVYALDLYRKLKGMSLPAV